MWEPRRLTTLWVSNVCYSDSVTFYLDKIVNESANIFTGPRDGSLDNWAFSDKNCKYFIGFARNLFYVIILHRELLCHFVTNFR
jgi:hypothetical protein